MNEELLESILANLANVNEAVREAIYNLQEDIGEYKQRYASPAAPVKAAAPAEPAEPAAPAEPVKDAAGYTYDDYIKAGWSAEQIAADPTKSTLTPKPVEPPKPAAPAAPTPPAPEEDEGEITDDAGFTYIEYKAVGWTHEQIAANSPELVDGDGPAVRKPAGPATPPSGPAAPPAGPATPPASPGAEVDKEGLPWDIRIHTKGKTKKKDGTWKNKPGLDPEVKAQVEAELRAAMAGAPAGPAAPPAGEVTWQTILDFITESVATGALEQKQVDEECRKLGIESTVLLAARPDLHEQIYNTLKGLAA